MNVTTEEARLLHTLCMREAAALNAERKNAPSDLRRYLDNRVKEIRALEAKILRLVRSKGHGDEGD